MVKGIKDEEGSFYCYQQPFKLVVRTRTRTIDNKRRTKTNCLFQLSLFTAQKVKPKCEEKQFHCGEGECIPVRFVCDGQTDCNDGSDENVPECKFPTRKYSFLFFVFLFFIYFQ